MIIEADRERIFAILNFHWHGCYDDYSPEQVTAVDCVKYTRPYPAPDGRDTYFHWLVCLNDGRRVAVATDEPGEREILHRNTFPPKMLVTYEDYKALDLVPPHCDPRVLHGPADGCSVCDDHAKNAQGLRIAFDVSFTGKTDKRWPCPADVARPNGQNQVWGGNRPWKDAL